MNDGRAPFLSSLLKRRVPGLAPLGPGDWARLAEAACRHNVGPFMYNRLKEDLSAAPRAVAEQLHDVYLESAASSLRLRCELARILREYRSQGIQVVPLKGAYLADAVYGSAALRTMVDIDLLVQPADLSRAVECLRALEYYAEYTFDPRAEQAISQHMPPMRAEGRTPVELHWTLANPGCGVRLGQSELNGIWSRVVPATIAGEQTLVLSREDLLLHLCMHASVQHCFGEVGLRPFADIAEVVGRFGGTLDWTQFTTRTNQWGVANGVRMVLTLAQEWTDLVVPAAIWPRLDGAPPDEQHLAWARQKILEGSPAVLASGFPRLASEAGRTGSLSTLRTALFPPRVEMARIYGVGADSWRVFACYPYRFRDLWRKYRGALYKLLTRDRPFMEQNQQEARLRAYLARG
jgi:hypothetical protein